MFIRHRFLLYFNSKCTFYDVVLMVVLLLLSFWLYTGYKHGFMEDSSWKMNGY